MLFISPRTLIAAAVIASVPLLATKASAQVGYYPYTYYQDPYTAHLQAEHEHMGQERHHLWHERNARDDALRRGDFFGAWGLQQHMNEERHHLRHEEEHHFSHE